MGFSSVDAIATAYDNGQFWQSSYYKATAPFIGANAWTDLSISVGLPVYQPYIGTPLKGVPVIGTANNYVFLGPTPPAGQQKYLLSWSIGGQASGATGATFILYDLLYFYPYVDGTSTIQQTFDNTATLPRYADGDGVLPIFITQTPGVSGAVTCDITYTDSTGTPNRSLKMSVAGATSSARIMALSTSSTTAATPFIQLANGDRGVRAVESVTFNSSVGGFATVALVKPLTQISNIEQGTYTERNFIREGFVLPEIKQDAALQIMFVQASGAGSMGTITSFFETVWG